MSALEEESLLMLEELEEAKAESDSEVSSASTLQQDRLSLKKRSNLLMRSIARNSLGFEFALHVAEPVSANAIMQTRNFKKFSENLLMVENHSEGFLQLTERADD